MNEIWNSQLEYIGGEVSLRIALTLLHFLWQGAAIGLLVVAGSWILRKAAASARYGMYSAALLCMPICVAVTFLSIEVNTPSAGGIAPVPSDAAIGAADGAESFPMESVPPAHATVSGDERTITELAATMKPLLARTAPFISVAYVLVALLLFLRLLTGTWGGHRLRGRSHPIIDSDLLQIVSRQARNAGLRLAPAVAFCERVAVPMVVGVFRPVVLLPASIVTGLDQTQFAAILSHELAHIRRHDLLMNLIQRIVESLLFFHPVVWFVSRKMSVEREASCDDLAVSCGHERMEYAGALLRMAELCSSDRNLAGTAVAASGHCGSDFEDRLRRLMEAPSDSGLRPSRSGMLAVLLLACSIAIMPVAFHDGIRAQDTKAPPADTKKKTDEASSPRLPDAGAGESAEDLELEFEIQYRWVESETEGEIEKENKLLTPKNTPRLRLALQFGGTLSKEGIERAYERAINRKPTEGEVAATFEWIIDRLIKDEEFREHAGKRVFGPDTLDSKWDESFKRLFGEIEAMMERVTPNAAVDPKLKGDAARKPPAAPEREPSTKESDDVKADLKQWEQDLNRIKKFYESGRVEDTRGTDDGLLRIQMRDYNGDDLPDLLLDGDIIDGPNDSGWKPSVIVHPDHGDAGIVIVEYAPLNDGDPSVLLGDDGGELGKERPSEPLNATPREAKSATSDDDSATDQLEDP